MGQTRALSNRILRVQRCCKCHVLPSPYYNWFFLLIHRIWGMNLFSANGDTWRTHRRVVGPSFNNALFVTKSAFSFHSNPNLGTNTYLKEVLLYTTIWSPLRNGRTGTRFRYRSSKTSLIRYSRSRVEVYFTNPPSLLCLSLKFAASASRSNGQSHPKQMTGQCRSSKQYKLWARILHCWFSHSGWRHFRSPSKSVRDSFASSPGCNSLVQDFVRLERLFGRLWVSWRGKWISGSL